MFTTCKTIWFQLRVYDTFLNVNSKDHWDNQRGIMTMLYELEVDMGEHREPYMSLKVCNTYIAQVARDNVF